MMGQGAESARFPFIWSPPGARRWRTLLTTLALATPAALGATLVVGLVVLLLAAAIVARSGNPPLGLLPALDQLMNFGRGGRSLLSYTFELSLAGLTSFAGAVAFLLVSARVQGRTLTSLLTTAPRFRWAAAAAGLAVFLPVVALEIGLEWLGGERPPLPPVLWPNADLAAKLVYALVAAVCLWLAALSEEMIFRGWLLQQTAVFTKSLALILGLNGILFSLAHFDPSPGAFVARAGLGVAWAWIVLRTGGIEFAAGAHLANNLGIALFSRPVTLEAPTSRSFDVLSVVVQVSSVAILVALVEVWRRRRPATAQPAT